MCVCVHIYVYTHVYKMYIDGTRTCHRQQKGAGEHDSDRSDTTSTLKVAFAEHRIGDLR